MSPKQDAYNVVTQKIIDALGAGHIPWSKPWRSVNGEMPTSLQTGKPYRGINVWTLSIESMLKGYASPYWATFKQAKERAVEAARAEGREIVEKSGRKGGKYYVEIVDGVESLFKGGVRKGEQGTEVVLWKPVRKSEQDANGDETTKQYLILRYYTVFNAEQCDGIEGSLPEVEPLPERTPIEAAEQIVSGFIGRPTIKHGGNSAHYVPLLDYVQMPERGQFTDSEGYYATLFHELAHSTGHSSRLNRPGIEAVAPFGSEDYSKEELVAEMAAAFLNGEAGLEIEIERSAGYIQHWLKVLKDDRRLLISAAAQAQKAADLILAIEPAKV